MKALRRVAKPVCYAVAASLLALNLHLPNAQAAMVGTGAVVASAQSQQDRSQLHAALERQEVRARLVALGVDTRQAHARVDALSDGEARDLARRLDQMPAGGDAFGGLVGAAVFVFIVLVFTDLLGLTSVFPFTNKGSLRT
ncbi:MAG: PA2779 family protein [Nitrospirota bacterium]|nr:PA2779 family protein [Nitrospirota bacterium]